MPQIYSVSFFVFSFFAGSEAWRRVAGGRRKGGASLCGSGPISPRDGSALGVGDGASLRVAGLVE